MQPARAGQLSIPPQRHPTTQLLLSPTLLARPPCSLHTTGLLPGVSERLEWPSAWPTEISWESTAQISATSMDNITV
ncbi:predicted protein [Plenodomus lingam JN3]|uniref:Predicted protein n=1 Tax=Leptosphaeria maculans (strain JN3 / isolate v23.1.3 / race Av1-4-5-6-7-8) TaxID=985895 RepID=E4ZV18_LEPMJ|nr:predicted protein [Plenodomus lingam JN3]CBX95444.1 predicted protein [Plenodomus lingam JN3]